MKYVLKGRVVTMDSARTVISNGAVYVDGNTITAVQDAGKPPPAGFTGAKHVGTNHVILPGFIELHNHLSYNILQLWSVPKLFQDRGQWQRHPQYIQLVNGPMLILAKSTDPRVLAAIARFAETKCLLGGVTSSQGISLKSDQLQKYYHGAMRVVEDPLDAAFPKAGTHIPDLAAKEWASFNKEVQKANCLLLHLSEGVDPTALNAFEALKNPQSGAWAISNHLAGIHCLALGDTEFAVMQANKGSMIWSPLSNLMLYGQTAKISTAKKHGVPIALGSDWSPSGSKNLLHELKVAKVANDVFNFGYSDADIVGLATSSAAAIVKWNTVVGSIEANKRADITMIAAPAKADPYSAIIAAHETDVELVIIDGQPTVGTSTMMSTLGAQGETITIGGEKRVISYGTPDPEITPISFADTTTVLAAALANLPNTPAPPPHLVHALGPKPKHVWSLALDEQHQTGFSLRPMLDFQGEPTGPDAQRLSSQEIVKQPVNPVPLDAVSVPDDKSYFDKINNQTNIPKNIKDGLKTFYA